MKRMILGVMLLAMIAMGKDDTPPNVIIVMTDDQGYGDIQSHGNPVLKTPEIDKLRECSVRFTDFHVAPMCTPTRGQLMTGMDAMRNGATAVCQGRSMMRNGLKIMPQYFSEAGYSTGMFGKWHLGDSYPHRPQDRGFQEVLRHRAWGITSLADYWGNDYFDPVLERNSMDTPYKGYCTDIYFNEAIKWIEACVKKKKPFFLYLPTNTPHVPEQVAKKYAEPYHGKHKNKKIPSNFYGMIANIDENIGKLEAFLEENGLKENTIFVYLTDNGTQSGPAQQIFNAGMRDRKTSVKEGGHRVPLYIRWPKGKLEHGKDFADLAQVQDILPTLIDLCGLKKARDINGISLARLLKGKDKKLDDRMCVVQYLIGGKMWKPCVVMWDKWRLIKPSELYNIADDPHQDRNVAKDNPEVVAKMKAHYEEWYKEASQLYKEPRRVVLGSKETDSVTLYASDWQGSYCDNSWGLKDANGNGFWFVDVEREGEYTFELRRWSEESGKTLVEGWNGKNDKGRTARPVAKAQLKINDINETIETKPEDTHASFTVKLDKGKTKLNCNLLSKDGKALTGAMYVKVTRE